MRRAIALLITLFFIIAITASIGIGLKYINEGLKQSEREKFMIQSRILLDDVFGILKRYSSELDINSSSDLSAFMSTINSVVLPLDDTTKIKLSAKSARNRININSLSDENLSLMVGEYLQERAVGSEYLELWRDLIGGVREDGAYMTSLYYDRPELFLDAPKKLNSPRYLKEINDYYLQNYTNANIKKIKFENIFYFYQSEGNASSYGVDLGFASQELKELLQIRTAPMTLIEEDGYEEDGYYDEELCANLSPEQNATLGRFGFACRFQPVIEVNMEMVGINEEGKKMQANIRFEYDLKLKKGSHFVYEI